MREKENAARLGRWGEAQAAAYLQRKGLVCIAANWRCRFGEIDLIARDDKYLCFIEVKLRKNEAFGPARAFVDHRKQERLRQTAALYLAEYPTALQPRFDVAEVYAPAGTATEKPVILYWENAF